MPLFFVNKEDISNGLVKISGDDAFHIARSLRMAVGDKISACDGEGLTYSCELAKIRDDICECKILSVSESSGEGPAKITLFMAFPKNDKLELVIQKSVELGVSKIIPFESERCIKRPRADKIDKQLVRLNRIAEEAAKQCGRGVLPEVMPPVGFDEVLRQAKEYDISLFCYEGGGTRSMKEILHNAKKADSICAIVGCEGGFSPEEARLASVAGLSLTNLGKRILRCETAPLYVLSSLSFFFEL